MGEATMEVTYDALKKRVAELETENASLSANQCLHSIHGDEAGNSYCPRIAELEVALVTARRKAMDEATQAPREIAMGHGLVDVCVCNHEGRYGLVLKPRAEYAPIGQETAPARSVVTLDGGCVVVWFDGPEFAGTIIEAIQEAAALRAAAKEGKP